MAENILKTKITLRNDTIEKWNSSEADLLAGEVALGRNVSGNYEIRIGTGDKSWSELSSEGQLIIPSNNVAGLKYDEYKVERTPSPSSSHWDVYDLKGRKSGTVDEWESIGPQISVDVQDYVVYDDVNGGKDALSNGNKIATIKDLPEISACVEFIGTYKKISSDISSETDTEAIVRTYPDAKRGNLVISEDDSKEFICVANLSVLHPTESDWRELGREGVYATTAELCTEIATRIEADEYLSSEISSKIFIKDAESDVYKDGAYGNLSVLKVSEEEYMSKVADGTLLKDGVLYVISADHFNVYGQKIVNLAEPEISSDAATKNYVDTAVSSSISAIEINGLGFTVENNKASLSIDVISCGNAN